ncbi:hypothetical protein BAUCODRAFT_33256 [Baudoinia panamericana UAMH 10762]|uniref:SWR1-complex protein 4 n=1 Tax=Baudoinia panamericana (strain UAMH 10762) TaxID=717646 RepID=M2NE94_BAUPA|nr:uncharacterized protein BAUCODRAFT_33256 [Baudoinia panamericana UAMH 10762]EMC97539.1 hypothetical protein BAUCODRAFT_33256 [Baudoinia panamericana UAMH 10762]
MATRADITAALGEVSQVPSFDQPSAPVQSHKAASQQPRRQIHKWRRTAGSRTRTSHWELKDRRWRRMLANGEATKPTDFSKYNIRADVPIYDDATYDMHLTHNDWSREETDYLLNTYRESYGKWPVIADRYDSGRERSMEELKARFYSVSATMLAIHTPISSMTAPQYSLYETLSKFDPLKEASRKKLAEGHLHRRQNEVDEESVLLAELQRIMLHQASLDNEREDLRRRLDHPLANTNGYQYQTSQALTTLWQQLLAADRAKKVQRLRPTGNSAYDGFPSATPTSARPRDSNAGLPDTGNAAGRRPTRDSLPSATTPSSAFPNDLSKSDLARFGVVHAQDKLPNGVTFASDRLSKPRVAKSTQQTEKIAAILTHIGVPDLIPLPTPAVIEQFDAIISKVHTLLDMRKLRDKEEQELRVREAEMA